MKNFENTSLLFSTKDLKRLVLPLIAEQFLMVIVGLCDSIMVASVGEAAVSSVSLIDTISTLIIQLFAALATGGAVVAGQYIGRKKLNKACESVDQLLIVTVVISIVLTALMYLFKNDIIGRIFGNISDEVRYNCNIYFLITMASIPFLALYNVGAAVFRVMGNSKVTMLVSLLMNAINVIGNAILIFAVHTGVEGVAIPTLISRMTAAIVIICLLNNQNQLLHFSKPFSFKLDFIMIKNILYIAVPNGFENCIFHVGKILVLSIASGFGTPSIAANAVCNNFSNFMTLPGVAIGAALLPVSARCVGAGDYKQVRYYTKKLLIWTYAALAAVNALMYFLIPYILRIYNLSAEATKMATKIVHYNTVCVVLIWALSFTVPNTLRAASDVKFCMVASIISMWTARVGASWLLAVYFDWGVFGIWVGMTIDWLVRAIIFVTRYLGKKWQIKKILN